MVQLSTCHLIFFIVVTGAKQVQLSKQSLRKKGSAYSIRDKNGSRRTDSHFAMGQYICIVIIC